MMMHHRTFSRRSFLGGSLSTLPLLLALRTAQAQPTTQYPRIIIADWALAETALGIGITPIGITDRPGYDTWVSRPALPTSILNLGNRFQPNLERIAALKPDLILASSYFANMQPALADIAPVEKIDIYTPNGDPFDQAATAALRIGELAGAAQNARTFISQCHARIDAVATYLRPLSKSPVLLTNLLSTRHMRVFGARSLFQGVLDRVAVENAWQGHSNYWGFATVSVDQLAPFDKAVLIAFEPIPDTVNQALRQSPILTQLPAIKRFGLQKMAPVATFGGLFAAARFAELLGNTVTSITMRSS
tara:strand:- start:258 stop:1172 length:915 start_codon:yes stop_codon:yes gene_type:complete